MMKAIGRVAVPGILIGGMSLIPASVALGKLQGVSQTLPQTNVVAVKLADMDGDGDLDAVIGDDGAGSNPSQVWLNRGDGSFENATLPGFEAVRALDVGDVDGDGTVDAWVIREDPSSPGHFENRILKNMNGTGRLQDAGIAPDYVADPRTIGLVRLLDYDNNGVQEGVRLFADPNTKDQAYGNPGSGNFVTNAGTLRAGISRDAAVGDLDGRFGPDIAVVNGATVNTGDTEGLIAYEYANGSLTAQPARPSRQGAEYTAVGLGDVSGDGRGDAVVATSGNEIDVWLVQGDGTFPQGPAETLSAGNVVHAVALADVDGDGHPDLIKGTDAGVEVWNNSGHADYFDDQPSYTVTTAGTVNQLALGDLDGDGDVDLLAAEGGIVEVLLNDAATSGGGNAVPSFPIGSGGGGGAFGPAALLLLLAPAAAGLRRRR